MRRGKFCLTAFETNQDRFHVNFANSVVVMVLVVEDQALRACRALVVVVVDKGAVQAASKSFRL